MNSVPDVTLADVMARLNLVMVEVKELRQQIDGILGKVEAVTEQVGPTVKALADSPIFRMLS